jgi:hypothetical protein
MSLAICFVIGVVVGRMYAPRRARHGLVVGEGLPVDRAVRRAVRRPELRAAFKADASRRER